MLTLMLRRTGHVAVATVALRPLLVLLKILMMLLITLMMFSDSLVFFWRTGLFGLFVSTCLFCLRALEAETMDDGYLARLATLASWPLISRQGFRVRPFVFMTNL